LYQHFFSLDIPLGIEREFQSCSLKL